MMMINRHPGGEEGGVKAEVFVGHMPLQSATNNVEASSLMPDS